MKKYEKWNRPSLSECMLDSLALAARCGFITPQMWEECICSDVRQARRYERLATLRRIGLLECANLYSASFKVFRLSDAGKRIARRLADLPQEISADLFYEKIKAINAKLDSAVILKTDLESQKTRTQSDSIDQMALKNRLERALKALESAPKENQRAIFANVIEFAEMHPMKVRLGLYAPTELLRAVANSDFKIEGRTRGSSTSVLIGALRGT